MLEIAGRKFLKNVVQMDNCKFFSKVLGSYPWRFDTAAAFSIKIPYLVDQTADTWNKYIIYYR